SQRFVVIAVPDRQTAIVGARQVEQFAQDQRRRSHGPRLVTPGLNFDIDVSSPQTISSSGFSKVTTLATARPSLRPALSTTSSVAASSISINIWSSSLETSCPLRSPTRRRI